MTEVREILRSVSSLSDVLDIGRCERFLDEVHAGRYTPTAHEEVLGGIVSMCAGSTALR